MWGMYVDYSIGCGGMRCVRHICSGADANNVKCMHSGASDHTALLH